VTAVKRNANDILIHKPNITTQRIILTGISVHAPTRLISSGDHTGSAAHPGSYTLGTEGSFAWGKAGGAWSLQLRFSDDVKNEWNYAYTPFPAICLHITHRNKFTCNFIGAGRYQTLPCRRCSLAVCFIDVSFTAWLQLTAIDPSRLRGQVFISCRKYFALFN
jgi:hypothetical protein